MGKVLVVDDDAGITLLLQRIISKKGHQIVVARNGLEGYAQAQKEHPDLILTDVRMPDLGGVELAAMLKENRELAAIPVVILSGTAYLIDLETTPADAVLTKPFDLKTVYALLDRYLGPAELGAIKRNGADPDPNRWSVTDNSKDL
ncbi:MAG TPA: response regulator [Chloroflexia bacterium]|nr:response regulator [Chloroflexia bacterium]